MGSPDKNIQIHVGNFFKAMSQTLLFRQGINRIQEPLTDKLIGV